MTPPVKPGEILAEKYRIERVLGRGGMGVVVAATHLELLELRAIKFMLPEHVAQPLAVERFLREARAAARLRGEHVAKVYDVGRFANGAPYMVMEYLEGIDLSAHLKQHGPLPVTDVATVGLQVCEALAEAHAARIIHRDLKPANLFLTRRADGSALVKVLDFGISKTVTQDVEMTTTLAVLGSPTYMSPEQMRSARSVDARADLWSLGVILYRLLTATLPFHGDNVTELIANVLSTTPTPPSELRPELPAALDAVVLRCLERDPDARYASALELARDLMPFAPPHASAAFDRLGIASTAPGSSPITISSSLSLRSMASVLAPPGSTAPSVSTGPSAASGPYSASAPSVPTGPSGGSGVGGVSAPSIASGAPAVPASSAITGPTGDAPVTLGSRASWGNTTPPPSTAPGASRRTIALAMAGASLLGVGIALFVWRLEGPVVAAAAALPSVLPSASATASASSTAASAPSAVASAAASASAEPPASAAVPAVAQTSEPAAKAEPKSPHAPRVTKPKTPPDPFGKSRK